ncbi:MAG TPA: hypothetical protein PLU72_15795 [Candidatus Ozemobacteraceae bacterium]|nr:hypothetical protein [Candidatus Ozemobacteraceae bacterium]HQG29561.1 hypothetical protein [Candidatus Ozemobacteraceae bacterium]
MAHFTGDDPFLPVMQAAMGDDGEETLLLDDRETGEPGSPWLSLGGDLLACLTDRSSLRAFTRSKNLPTPEGAAAATFDQLSAWIVRRQKFPLALKSCRNASNGAGIFRMEGFRELTGFYEKIQAFEAGPVLVEEWIEPRALIEVSVAGSGLTLMTQVGLDRTLSARWSWRMFPLRLPQAYKAGVENILTAFAPMLNRKGTLLRFTIALTEDKRAVLLSVSCCANRIEYYPGWCESAGVQPLARHLFTPPAPAPVKPPEVIGRLQFFRNPDKTSRFPETLPASAAKIGTNRYASVGRYAAALLTGTDPNALSRDGKILSQIIDEERLAVSESA